MNRANLAGVGAITLTSLLWGTTGTAATFATGAGPLPIAAAALGVGGILQAAVAVPALRAAYPALRANPRLVLLGVLAVAVYPLAFYSSMHYAGVAVGSVVSLASAPLAAGVIERIIDGRRLGRVWAVAAGLGIAGSVLLCLSRMQEQPAVPGALLAGMALGLVAGATYASYSWSARSLMSRGISRAASMGAVFGGGGVLLMPVLLLTGAPLVASREAFLVAAYMALVPMFLGYLLFGYGLTRTRASTATTVTLSEPAVAALLAVLVVGERFGPVGWAGLAAIGVAVAILAAAASGPEANSPEANGPRADGLGADGQRG